MKRDFESWLKTFRDSISDYKYYVDFEKVYRNVNDIRIELNIMNSLIGSKDIDSDFKRLIKNYPEIIKTIPVLLAKRGDELYCQNEQCGILYKFNSESNITAEQYSFFMKETGLFDLLSNHIINNLVDYVTGIETGLDSNGRKNRGGHLMENLVEKFIIKAGFKLGSTYFKEMCIADIQRKWDYDLSAVTNGGKSDKRFDYVVKTEAKLYVIETNFYSSGGSKLNETARSYKTLAQEIGTIPNVVFIWFTDGSGWNSAKNNLEETFDVLDTVYNISDMENEIMSLLFV